METILTQEQIAAVRCMDNYILLIAGPGTGKTTVLTKRIIHLINDLGVKENDIHAFTFTNKATNEMKSRIASDSCYECGDAIVYVDAKTIALRDNDHIHNKVNVEAAQTSYDSSQTLTIVGKPWTAKLPHVTNHKIYGNVPSCTYVIKAIYSTLNTGETIVNKIILQCIPNGQLYHIFSNTILAPGKSSGGAYRTNIRFLFNTILATHNWIEKIIYNRK